MYPGVCAVCYKPVTDPNLYHLPEHGLTLLLGTRCASTSVKRAILQSMGEPDHDPHNSLWLLSRHVSEPPEGPAFVFVRDPLGRAISTWRYLVRQRYWPHMACYGIEQGDSFAEFAERLSAVDQQTGDLHLRPISSNTAGRTSWQIVRHEALRDGWARVQRASKVKLPSLRLSNESVPEALAVGAVEAGMVRRYYEADYRAFGY